MDLQRSDRYFHRIVGQESNDIIIDIFDTSPLEYKLTLSLELLTDWTCSGRIDSN